MFENKDLVYINGTLQDIETSLDNICNTLNTLVEVLKSKK